MQIQWSATILILFFFLNEPDCSKKFAMVIGLAVAVSVRSQPPKLCSQNNGGTSKLAWRGLGAGLLSKQSAKMN